MRTPLKDRIRRVMRAIIRKITGHKYGCCNDLWKRCGKCVYVMDEVEDGQL